MKYDDQNEQKTSYNPHMLLEDIKKLRSENEVLELQRDVQIRLLEPVKTQSRYGRDIFLFCWEYYTVGYDYPEWRQRTCRLDSNEAKLMIDNAPYEENGVYRVHARKNKSGFFEWYQIDLLEGAYVQLEGEENE